MGGKEDEGISRKIEGRKEAVKEGRKEGRWRKMKDAPTQPADTANCDASLRASSIVVA